MLLKIERVVLHELCSKKHQNQVSANCFKKYSGEDIYQAMLDLKEKGYLNQVDASIDCSNFSYVLNSKGKYYSEYIFMLFLRNIIIPIAISILTTLLTLSVTQIIDNYSNKTGNYAYENWANPINESPKQPIQYI